ncbi:MAG: N-6 DNA methylase, partial [Nitrospiraceae bacterium]|nr:N-6 DNA methylase [Nitrospiraceae bacterium]
MNSATIVQKIWSYCDVLRDVGVSYGDYLEQLTYLLFLKMADEYGKPPYNSSIGIPAKYTWPELKKRRGAELESFYVELLRDLGRQKGMLGQIFTKAQNKIQDPAMLYRVIDMIDKEQWTLMGADVKGRIYEGLLAKNAEDVKSGAGQYFTPRPLIRAMVECVRPEPGRTIADPACGTGGFFLGAYDFISQHHQLNKAQKEFLKFTTFYGNEIVANTRRLALMNMLLHGIGDIDAESSIDPTDALIASPKQTFDYVLTNPPFGKKSAITITNGEGKAE